MTAPHNSPETDHAIAVEHAVWAEQHGQRPGEVMLALGVAVLPGPTWGDAIKALYMECRRMSGAIPNPSMEV